jgi:hypothetical protein
MSLAPTREDHAWSDGYRRASNAGAMVIEHLSKRLREVEAERDRMKASLEALRDDPAVPPWIQTLATGSLTPQVQEPKT